MAYVRILPNEHGRFYVGSTTNLFRKLKQHESGSTPFTARLESFRVVLSQEYGTLYEARCVEIRLKNLKRHDYLEKMVKDGVIRTKSE